MRASQRVGDGVGMSTTKPAATPKGARDFKRDSLLFENRGRQSKNLRDQLPEAATRCLPFLGPAAAATQRSVAAAGGSRNGCRWAGRVLCSRLGVA